VVRTHKAHADGALYQTAGVSGPISERSFIPIHSSTGDLESGTSIGTLTPASVASMAG